MGRMTPGREERPPSQAHRSSTERRLQTLLDASLRLSQSIDYERTLDNVVRFVAERFASYSLLDIVRDDGRIERAAVAHSDPERTALVERLRAFHPPAELVATHPVSRAIARNEATLEAIDGDWIARSAISPEHARTMHDLRMRALLVVPVVNGRRVVGALTCALDASSNLATFDADDIAFAEELGRRAGIAIDNARLYEREHRIARTLQEASLPRRLPQLASLRLDAYYRPGRSEATIGGDWYDAFAIADGRLALTIGDVVGKGLAAAVTMGRLRQSMETAALLAPRADTMLEIADRTLRMQDEDLYATGIAALYDPERATFSFANAGHPEPMVRHSDGSVERVRVAGAMLGLGVDGVRSVVALACTPGSMLVLFTDGLIEFDRDFEAGERRVAAEFARPSIVASRRPARALVDAVLGEKTPTDDIAVLVATLC
jgi:GAF domain-containing protein